MRLELKRPLVSIDFETTSKELRIARIVSIGMKKISQHEQPQYFFKLVNPTIPIPCDATKIHGITDENVADQPTFAELAGGVADFIAGCDIAGYSILSYDMPLLYSEFLRAGIVWDYSNTRFIDALNIARQKEPHSLSWASLFYCDHEHQNAHDAMSDANAAANVLLAQVERYDDLPGNIGELAKFSNYGRDLLDFSGRFIMNDAGVVVFNFGKHKNESAADHKDYLSWMIDEGEFNPDTKILARKILES